MCRRYAVLGRASSGVPGARKFDQVTGQNGRDMEAYKRVLARPGVRSLMITMLLARIPVTATSILLTLHVILGKAQGGLGLSYAAAGGLAALFAVGNGVGAPLVGRAIDRVGLFPV